ncbi:MAG: single-stranded-DNA-specific exonuclease RecJ [Chloroflexota bacterium]
MHSKRWQIASPPTPQARDNLSSFPNILAQLAFNRGHATLEEARNFFNARTLHSTDPFQMTGMQATVERLRRAIAGAEPIAIYGDYDVDGVTATALLVQALKALGADVRPYIPNRFDEGYGLNTDALDTLAGQGVRLVITVDCGIRSPVEAAHARTLGLDLVITDHHHPGDELPPAFAVINPKQAGDAYPYKELAGVGIAFKLAEALFSSQPPADSNQQSAISGQRSVENGNSAVGDLRLGDLLDLVALGTVADLAPLTGENRALVRRGLRQMHQTTRQGLFSLANVSGIELKKISATHIGFMLGPRLNASGRLEDAIASYELLTTTDVMRAGQLAQQLNVQNIERQRITRQMQKAAEEIALADDPEAFLLFAAREDFNPGVVGLAAARLTEAYYRPAIVAHHDAETTRGSCRSIPEFHITDALDACADLLVRHGGHAAAAGFTVENDKLPELVSRLKAIAAEKLSGADLRRTLNADLEVPLAELSMDLLKNLSYLEPTGYGNPEAVFVSRNLRVTQSRTVGQEGKHLKLKVTDGKNTFDAIGFRLGHLQPNLPERVDLMYAFEPNEFNGRVTPQLNLKDVKPAGTPD